MTNRPAIHGLLWCVAAGVALALAMPGPSLWPLVVVFPGLLLEGCSRLERRWHGALLGLAAGVAHWVVATHWIADVLSGYGGLPLVGAWASVLGMGLILGSLWMPVGAVIVGASPTVRVWVVPLVWIVMETLRRFQPLAFPWNTTGTALTPVPALLQSLPVWGAGGLGWAVTLLGAGLWAVVRREHRRVGLAAVGTSLGLITLCTLIAPPAQESGDSLTVAIVQPGTSLEERWDPNAWPIMADRVWRLTAEAAAEQPDIILWPESAMPFRWESDSEYRRQVTALTRRTGASILLNSVGEANAGWTNAAFAITPEGEVTRYDKIRLVPFGEYVPAWARAFFPGALVREVGGFIPGRDATPLQAGRPVGMAVCYEIVFPGLAARQVRNGAQVLTTLTNDAWYGDSWALRQHFAHAILRSVEMRRFTVRAALTGISGIVDPRGRVVDDLDIGATGVLVGAVRPATGITPRARFGEWVLGLAAVMAGVAVAIDRRRR
jgi:apolipoprotein N-acyltransferase